MITVTEEWKEAHNQRLLPETFIEISYAVTEPGLQEEANATANMAERYSNAKSITSAVTVDREKYNSLEWNFWGLDGSFSYFDETPEHPGYVASELSNEDGTFGALPTIEISFPNLHTVIIPGITITWTETFSEWSTHFRLIAYSGTSIVAEKVIEDNREAVSQVWLDLVGYDKLVIEVIKWSHPQHRARVARVYLGIRAIYTKDDLLGYTHTQSVDLLSAALPKNEISFRLRNEDSRWNPENPSGAERYLIERQEVRVKYGMAVNGVTEWIEGGHFWLSAWSTPANGLEASFTARDVIEFMNERYTGPTSGTLYNIANAAFLQAQLPIADTGMARYWIDSSLSQYSTAIDSENTIAEVLQKVAHMACCVMYQDRNGVIRIEPRNILPSDYTIRRDFSYSHPEFEYAKPLKSVDVRYGEENYLLSITNSGEVQTVDNDFIKTAAEAQRVAEATATVLRERKTISGDFRADPRLDALDIVTVESKFATNPVVISEIEYSTTGGGFYGRFTGKVIQDS